MILKMHMGDRELAEPLTLGAQPAYLASPTPTRKRILSPEMEVYLATCQRTSVTQEQRSLPHLDAEMRKDRSLEDACRYMLQKLVQQKGLDLLDRFHVLNELIESEVIPYEFLKEQMSALFAELFALTGKMDEANGNGVPTTLQTLIENMCVSYHFWSEV